MNILHFGSESHFTQIELLLSGTAIRQKDQLIHYRTRWSVVWDWKTCKLQKPVLHLTWLSSSRPLRAWRVGGNKISCPKLLRIEVADHLWDSVSTVGDLKVAKRCPRAGWINENPMVDCLNAADSYKVRVSFRSKTGGKAWLIINMTSRLPLRREFKKISFEGLGPNWVTWVWRDIL